MDFEGFREEGALEPLPGLGANFSLNPFDRIRKFDPKVRPTRMLIEGNWVTSHCTNIGRDDSSLIMRKRKMERTPQVTSFNVGHGNQAGLFKMADKTANS